MTFDLDTRLRNAELRNRHFSQRCNFVHNKFDAHSPTIKVVAENLGKIKLILFFKRVGANKGSVCNTDRVPAGPGPGVHTAIYNVLVGDNAPGACKTQMKGRILGARSLFEVAAPGSVTRAARPNVPAAEEGREARRGRLQKPGEGLKAGLHMPPGNEPLKKPPTYAQNEAVLSDLPRERECARLFGSYQNR